MNFKTFSGSSRSIPRVKNYLIDWDSKSRSKFQNNVNVINNNVDSKTGEFLRNSKTVDKDTFEEFTSIFPNLEICLNNLSK